MVAGTMKTSTEFLKKTKNQVTIWSSNPTPRHISRKDEHSNLKRYTHPNVHRSTFTTAETWKQTKRPLTEEWIRKMWYTHTHTHTHTLECYSSINEWNTATSSNMDGPRDYWLSEVSQIEKRQILYGVIYTWNLKNNANGLVYKTQTDLQN